LPHFAQRTRRPAAPPSALSSTVYRVPQFGQGRIIALSQVAPVGVGGVSPTLAEGKKNGLGHRNVLGSHRLYSVAMIADFLRFVDEQPQRRDRGAVDARRCAPSFLEVVRNRVTSLRCRAFGTVSVGFSGMPSEAPAPATHGNDAKSATLRVHYR
jgi:hypothetical protein